MTAPRGPGFRGLKPGPGDAVLIGAGILPWLDVPHWYRVATVDESDNGRLRLTGCLIGRADQGEYGTSQPLTVLIERPAELIVDRSPARVPAPHGGPRLPGLVEQLVQQARPGPELPASVRDALAQPDRHRPAPVSGHPEARPVPGLEEDRARGA